SAMDNGAQEIDAGALAFGDDRPVAVVEVDTALKEACEPGAEQLVVRPDVQECAVERVGAAPGFNHAVVDEHGGIDFEIVRSGGLDDALLVVDDCVAVAGAE